MKIVIASSKQWFKVSDGLKINNKILFIKKKSDLTFQNLKKFDPQLVFFPHWSWKVPTKIHNNFCCIVFHTAPLPFGKGGSPIQNLIIRGYRNSPVCALRMVEGLDSGPIYIKKDLSLNGSLTEILARLNLIINELIIELINFLPPPIKQKGQGTYFKRLDSNDNLIPQNISLEEVFDRIRMLDDPSYPKSFIKYGDFIIEFSEAELVDDKLICKAKIKFQR